MFPLEFCGEVKREETRVMARVKTQRLITTEYWSELFKNVSHRLINTKLSEDPMIVA